MVFSNSFLHLREPCLFLHILIEIVIHWIFVLCYQSAKMSIIYINLYYLYFKLIWICSKNFGKLILFAFLCTIYYEITIFLMSWNSYKQTKKIGYFSVILGWNSFFQVCLLLVFIEFLLLCTHVPCFICVHWSLCLKYNGISLWLCFLTYWFSLKTNHAQKIKCKDYIEKMMTKYTKKTNAIFTSWILHFASEIKQCLDFINIINFLDHSERKN